MNPRERTAAHLQKLAQVATLGLVACTSSQGQQNPGYAVVDPMPPPAQPCTEVADEALVGQLWSWSRGPDSNGVSLINLDFSRVKDLVVAPEPSFEGAEFVSRSDTGQSLQLQVRAAGKTAPVVVHLGLSCQGTPKKLKLVFAQGLGGANPTLSME